MDILKDLPSHDKENFSRYSHGIYRVSGPYCRVGHSTVSGPTVEWFTVLSVTLL